VRKLLLLASTFAALAATAAVSAGADTISFTLIAPGPLTISAPAGNVSLGSQVSSNVATTISGQLGTVTVSDERGGARVWVASVIATAFTPVPTGTAIAASAISYSAGGITIIGAATGTAVAAPSLSGVSPVVNGTSTGTGTASWNPTISVLVPADFAAGVYTSTITHSVA
jgi:hypothetical protein